MSFVSNLIKRAGPAGLYRVARQLTAGVPKILMYHRFSESRQAGYTSRENFEEQLRYLKQYHTVLTLNDIVSARLEQKPVAPNAVVLTIDDGFLDFYSIAFPLLQQYQLPATLFVTTGFINGDLWLWPDKVSWLLAVNAEPKRNVVIGSLELAPGAFSAHRVAETWQRLIDYLLTVADAEKHRLIAELSQQLLVELPARAPDHYQACSWQQLREMQQAGIEIGGHTVTHPSLGQVPEAEVRREIEGCRDMLIEHLGEQARPFCYPNGTVADFTPFVKRVVEESGFIAAVTAFDDCEGTNDRFAMRRFPCDDNMFQFYKCVSGVQHLGNRFRKTEINA